MKALTDVVTFDRISTREELRQVLDLLSDVNTTNHDEIWDLPETAGPCDIGADAHGNGAWPEAGGPEHSQAADLATLANMFIGRHERTN